MQEITKILSDLSFKYKVDFEKVVSIAADQGIFTITD